MLPDKKTIYHSELVAACEAAGGRLHVRFTSSPAPSKYQGKPPYIMFEAEGEGEKTYNIENATIEALLRSLPQHTPLWIQASGSRDAAMLMAWNDAGQPVGDSSVMPAAPPATPPAPDQNRWGGPSSAPPPPPAAAPTNGTGWGAAPAKENGGRSSLAATMYLCLEAAFAARAQFFLVHGRYPDAEEWVSARTLFIEESRSAGTRTIGAPSDEIRRAEQAGQLPGPGDAPTPPASAGEPKPEPDPVSAMAQAAGGAPEGESGPWTPDEDDLPF